MKKNTVNYQTLIVTFAEPIRTLDNYFDDVEAWGVASLKEWIDSYESTRFTQTDDCTAVITSEYCNKQILNRHFSVKLNHHLIIETTSLYY